AEAAAPVPQEGIIGAEDLLEINVFELPELKTTSRVMGDGTISLPLLGVVQAAGMTTTGLEGRIRDLLEERFVHDPQVTITVSEHRSRQVSVIGAVTKPGPYEMLGPRTVLQMISEAGGLTKDAGVDIFIIRRTESGRGERIHLDLDELVTKGNPDLNVAVSPGDVINVPVDRPIFVYVDGAVKTPGQIEGKISRPITLLQAVARAGGLTERASLRGAHILRKTEKGGQIQIPVDLRALRKGKAEDIVLVDGDVVVVPETFF
ncbi:MAG TPA: polysaccharide biosynthesis/export family protein, partial [Candidatus Polarisedimenticolia bacterium]|nr:polysaccharide biosynthesis/export family protein [Candidatus Polarisedimenticolia bacterium]